MLVLGLITLLLASSASVASGTTPGPEEDMPPFQLLSNRTVLTFDAHGDQVAWAAPAEESVEILVTNLSEGRTDVRTRIPGDPANISVEKLGFDGRWIVWSDDRYGQREVFALDTQTISLQRVTDHPADDLAGGVDEGWMVWERRESIYVSNLSGGTSRLFHAGAGPRSGPVVDGGLVAWSQIDGRSRAVALGEFDAGSWSLVARGPDAVRREVRIEDNRILWLSLEYANPARPEEGVRTSRLQGVIVDLDHVDPAHRPEITNVTPDGHGWIPVAGGGQLGWVSATASGDALLTLWSDGAGRAYLLPPTVREVSMTSQHVVLSAKGASGPILYSVAWDELEVWEPSDPWGWLPGALLLGGGMLLMAIGLAWRPLSRLCSSLAERYHRTRPHVRPDFPRSPLDAGTSLDKGDADASRSTSRNSVSVAVGSRRAPSGASSTRASPALTSLSRW